MILMKNFCLVAALLITASSSFAQHKKAVEQLPNFDKQPVHWGYYLGLNSYDFLFQYNNRPDDVKDVLVTTSLGFNVGLIGNLRISDNFDLRLEPGLYYTKRILNFQNPELTGADAIRETNSTYIHVPLLLKASSNRWGNVRPYLVGGVSTSLNLGSREKSIDDNSTGTFRMTKNTNYWEVGMGIDFYLPTFKFSPSLRGVFAMTNEMVNDVDPNSPWTSDITSIKTRGIFINFTFE